MIPTSAHPPESLTYEERAAFAALPRERLGAAELETRVVRALAAQSLLRPMNAPPFTTHSARFRAFRVAALAAAALLIFFAGAAVGRVTSVPAKPAPHTATSSQLDSASVALLVQRAGSEFVHTLEQIPTTPNSADHRGSQEREVARSTLRAAAWQFARVAPDDPVANLILERLQPEAAQTLWF